MPEASDHPKSSFSIAPGTSLGTLLKRPPIDPVDARVLTCHALRLTRVQLVTQSERVLGIEEARRLTALFQRRIAGEPVAYLLGEREFFGLTFYTSPDVLIPRPETELLVELALERLPPHGRVLDMGTGSGAIAIALSHARRDAAISATDISERALATASRNAARHQVRVDFLLGDWFTPLAGRQFDLIVSNPPYIVAGDPHLSQGDLRFEPLDALTDHADGLSALRTIVEGAPAHLVEAGWLLMEHGYDQSAAVRQLLVAQGYKEVRSWTDLAGIERVTGGRR